MWRLHPTIRPLGSQVAEEIPRPSGLLVARYRFVIEKQPHPENLSVASEPSDAVHTAANQFVAFTIGAQNYCVDIMSVREIRAWAGTTSLPNSADFIRGVINLRGKVIPVMDLRLRFKMEAIDYTGRTCIIVVEITGSAGQVQIGTVVDSVSEVLNIKGEDIEDTPTFGTKLDTEFIMGMAKMEGGVKILLDIDKVLSAEEVAVLEKAS